MPDLNYRNPAVRTEMERLAKLWLDRGVDGFRLDAARYLIEDGSGTQQQDTPETHDFWREFAAFVRQAKPESTMVGEMLDRHPDDRAVLRVDERGGRRRRIADELRFPARDRDRRRRRTAASASGIATLLAQVQADYPPGAIDAPFLTNHDQIRVATQLGNNAGRLRNAAAILLTLPGSPFLYYGEEVGLQNGGTGADDELKRTPMPWDGTPRRLHDREPLVRLRARQRHAPTSRPSPPTPDSLLSRYRSSSACVTARRRCAGGPRSSGDAGATPVLAILRPSSAPARRPASGCWSSTTSVRSLSSSGSFRPSRRASEPLLRRSQAATAVHVAGGPGSTLAARRTRAASGACASPRPGPPDCFFAPRRHDAAAADRPVVAQVVVLEDLLLLDAGRDDDVDERRLELVALAAAEAVVAPPAPTGTTIRVLGRGRG